MSQLSKENKPLTIEYLSTMINKGLLEISPEYQRGNIWPDNRKRALIDSVRKNYPIGSLILAKKPPFNLDEAEADRFDCVDGQQRLTTLKEFVEGAPWTMRSNVKTLLGGSESSWVPYTELTQRQQAQLDTYLIDCCQLSNLSESQANDIFARINLGVSLSVGEKLNAIQSRYKVFIERIAGHAIFQAAVNDKGHNTLTARFGHITIATTLLMLQIKPEYRMRADANLDQLQEFLYDRENKFDASLTMQAEADIKKIMNQMLRIYTSAIQDYGNFKKYIRQRKVIQIIYIALFEISQYYALQKSEGIVGSYLADYFKQRDDQETAEYKEYTQWPKTGVLRGLSFELYLDRVKYTMLESDAFAPKDPQRFFNKQQKIEIFAKAPKSPDGETMCANYNLFEEDGRSRLCSTPITTDYFHADHIKPYRVGGRTIIENGQPLCAECNLKKGGKFQEEDTEDPEIKNKEFIFG
jgi:hypothetical protein